MIKKLKSEIQEMKILLRSIPSIAISLFILSVIAMNISANKSINLPVDWLALDCGIVFSWLAFLSMDVITKHFGPKAATKISVLVAFINIFCCILFFLISKIPGVWGESFVPGSEDVINSALDKTFGGLWYVLLGSTVAFLIAAVINNFSNSLIGKIFKTDNVLSFSVRSYVSTALGQFFDNLVFALIVSYNFFGWSLLECITCAITGMIVELLCEVLFLPLGYKISKDWKENNVGSNYFNYIKGEKNK